MLRKLMFARSKPSPDMIELVCRRKARQTQDSGCQQQGRELNLHRIHKFKLDRFVDFFISSCFVHFRKPDADIYRMALDIAQVQSDRVVYIKDRPMFVQVAETLGIRSIRHTNCQTTRARLAAFGLKMAP